MTKSRGIGRGGRREGAGGKSKPPVYMDIPAPTEIQEPPESPAPLDVADLLSHKDPKVFLLALMNDSGADVKLRADAAKALMPFMHKKIGEGGVKDQKKDAAKVAGAGRFGAVEPPRLVASNGR